jgi:anaerobic selenocysteine-containing dehydrogenase
MPSRRSFLKQSSLAMAVAATAPALPGLLVTTVSQAGVADAPAAESTVTAAGAEAGGTLEPLVAHIHDLASGEMTLYLGTNEVSYRDPEMAARLLRAAR